MEPPKYDGKESVTRYIRRVEEFKQRLQKQNYNIIIQFINDWLQPEIKYKSLSNFKNIPYTVLLTNEQHTRQLLDNYTSVFSEQMNIVILSAEELAASVSIKSEEVQKKKIKEYPIKILSNALKTIQYKLLYSKTGYTIKMYKSNIS